MAAKKTKRRAVLERGDTPARVIALVLDGLSDQQVATRLSTTRARVSRQAITKFRKRHAAEIQAQQVAVVEAVRDTSIRDKAQRISNADVVATKIMEWVETHGLVTETQTVGDEDETIITRRFNRAIVSALKDIQEYVAEELGELPKAGVNFNLNEINQTAVLDMGNFSDADKARVLMLALRRLTRGHE